MAAGPIEGIEFLLAKEQGARSFPLPMKSTTIDKESEAWALGYSLR